MDAVGAGVHAAPPAPWPGGRVLHDVPAAVLLVDVEQGLVVHANPAARALSDLPLPVDARAWAAHAGLATPGGAHDSAQASPLERAAHGKPVFGEPVTALRDGTRHPLWVTGFPLPQTPPTALVVLFAVENCPEAAGMRDRAVIAAGLSFTISDPRLPDNPLVYVNPAFERTTGYGYDEVVGSNCRFLQGPSTEPEAVEAIRRAIREQEHAVVTLLNYRKDGTAFWNELSLSPVHDGDGVLTHFVGIQADVTARVHGEQERTRVLLAERAARAAAERAQRRLALLAEATTVLAATLDVEASLARLADLAVPVIADFCMVELVPDAAGRRQVACAHADPGRLAEVQRVQELQVAARTAESPAARVLAGGPPLLLSELPGAAAFGPELLRAYEALGGTSAIVVPLVARRAVLGALSLVAAGSRRAYDEDDLSMAADLARRAALTVDNARLYEREHSVAEALQRALLPELPAVDGLDVAARYLPGSASAQVGGDWYDLFGLPDGAIGVAVGDVMGHDLIAAAAMGQLRSVLRSYAWQGDGPALVLDHLDQLVQGLQMAQLATAIYARLQLPEGDSAGRLVLANAGHLPPVLRGPDGVARLLDGAVSLLVGAAEDVSRTELSAVVERGSVLVLCTDGLVERRDRDSDAGLEALRAAVEAVTGSTAESICDELLSVLDGTRRDDDVALLVVRVL